MKTTDVFVEQVLIGFLVLLVPGLLFLDGFEALASAGDGSTPSAVGAIFGGLGVVGASYLVGIPLDRVIDTILQGAEQRLRLWHAKALAKHRAKNERDERDDPFPEGEWRSIVLSVGTGLLDYHNYLRSRIRLSRAMAVMGPGLTFAGMYALNSRLEHSCELRPTPLMAGGVIALVYMIAFLIGSSSSLPKTDDDDWNPRWRERWKLRVDPAAAIARSHRKDYKRWRLCVFLADPAVVLLAFSLLALVLWAIFARWDPALIVLGLAGCALSAASLWTWTRITKTYFLFLGQAHTRVMSKDETPNVSG